MLENLKGKINLQLFAEPAEDDDLTPDEDFDINELFEEEEPEQEPGGKPTEESGSTEEPEEKAEETEQEEEPAKEPTFTQADVDRILQERLARDRKSQYVKELEELTGMEISGIVDYAKRQRVVQRAEEMGITEEEAEKIVTQEEKLREYDERMKSYEQQQQAIRSALSYGQEKAQHLNNPIVKKYEKEIDNFAQGGLQCSFIPAMNFVLGQKVISGELTEQMKNAAEQKTLANISKRSKIAVEKAGGVAPASTFLTPQEKRMAANLGISFKEYAEEKEKLKNKR